MLELDVDLPAAALADGPEYVLEACLSHPGDIWLQGRSKMFDLAENEAVTAWRPRVGSAPAVPTRPNVGNGRVASIGRVCAFQTTAGAHCGLVVPDIAKDLSDFSLALIYRLDPVEEPRTLVTLNARGNDSKEGSYFFISDLRSEVTLKDTREALNLTLPSVSDPGAPRLLVVTVSGNKLLVQQDGGRLHEISGKSLTLAGAVDLFIGTRSNRGGLQKKLGQAQILDIFFWPGGRMLRQETDRDQAQWVALMRYFNWIC